MFKKFTSSIAGASIFIASFNFLSKGIGFLREILFASLFGLSANFDIYLVGAVLPLTINVIVICLGQNYLIPAYNKLKEKSSKLSEHFVLQNFLIFISGGIIISGILYLFSEQIITSYLQNTSSNLKVTGLNIFNLFLITIPITCGISVISAYQQSNFEFKYPVISQLLCNIIILLTVFILKDLNIYSIPVGYIIGSILQLTLLIVNSKSLFKNFFMILKTFEHYKETISVSFIIIILIESIGQLYIISDRYFFSYVSFGGISALNYSFTIFLFPLSILSIALSTAIFPKFSQLFSKKSDTELERVLNEGMIISISIFTPIMFLFMLYGNNLLKIIFERGMFTGTDTILTSEVLFYYSISIIFYATYSILNKMIYSVGLINKLLFITIVGIGIKILLNYLLANNMQQNGLALSTSISFIFFFFASLFLIYKRFPFMQKNLFFTELFFHLLNGIISILIIKQFSLLFPENLFFSFIELIVFISFYSLNLILIKSTS
ncbi:MAG TPA: lipid II flippase MurJ, partial [Ignavibacteriaceae bacterium]|nr:lipid II flippase MurJ [Ignavibacteriaceae bacterium]